MILVCNRVPPEGEASLNLWRGNIISRTTLQAPPPGTRISHICNVPFNLRVTNITEPNFV